MGKRQEVRILPLKTNHEILSSMTREEMISELEGRGFACSDDEENAVLAEAIALDRRWR